MLYFLRSTDIHTLSNIRILANGIVGAAGAERRLRACVIGGISLSPRRGQSLSLSTFSIDCYTYSNFYILDYFSRFTHVTLRYAPNLIHIVYIFGRFKLLILLEADVSLTSVSQINAITWKLFKKSMHIVRSRYVFSNNLIINSPLLKILVSNSS